MPKIVRHSYLELKILVNSYLEQNNTGAQLFSAKNTGAEYLVLKTLGQSYLEQNNTGVQLFSAKNTGTQLFRTKQYWGTAI